VKDEKTVDGSFGITSDDLYHKLKTTDSLLLLDLRDKSEYESRHIQGAVLVSSYHKTDLGVLPNVAKTNKEIVLVCLDGSQSSQYAKMLSETGIGSHYLIGGMDNWNHSLYHPSYKMAEKFS
jgi:rhodanese-related sulfurtransferase